MKTISPRGIGRPDGTRYATRAAIRIPLTEQYPWRTTNTLTNLGPNSDMTWVFDPEVQEGYILYITDIIVTTVANVLIYVSPRVVYDDTVYDFAPSFGYQKVIIKIPDGFPVLPTWTMQVYVKNYSDLTLDEVNINVIGLMSKVIVE